MSNWRTLLFKTGLNTIFLSRLHRVLAPPCRGVGAILTLHHVRPAGPPSPFAPNDILDITPAFLATAIDRVRTLGSDVVSLDEAVRRLREQDFRRHFVSFTLDDGYLDNYQHALPVFERREVPFTIYVATSMPEGKTVMWWAHLEQVIKDRDRVSFEIDRRTMSFETSTVGQKHQAFNQVYWALRRASDTAQKTAVEAMLTRYRQDPEALCRKEAMSWADLEAVARHPLATIGVHTRTHPALSKLSDEDVCEEATGSRQELADRLGLQPSHFCYPFGDPGSAGPREFDLIRELGFASATTTRKGVLFPEHALHLHALPRISLNGDYQKIRYLDVFLSGTPFAAMPPYRRLDVN